MQTNTFLSLAELPEASLLHFDACQSVFSHSAFAAKQVPSSLSFGIWLPATEHVYICLQARIVGNMFKQTLNDSSRLLARYDFTTDNIKPGTPSSNGISRVMHLLCQSTLY